MNSEPRQSRHIVTYFLYGTKITTNFNLFLTSCWLTVRIYSPVSVIACTHLYSLLRDWLLFYSRICEWLFAFVLICLQNEINTLNTGCPIKNNSSLKPCHFGSDQFFFKRFSLYESLTVILYACHSAKLETFRICLHIVAKLGHFLKKYHLDFWANRQFCAKSKYNKSMIMLN